MATYQIFIAHASEDDQLAYTVKNALRNIYEFRPYLAEDYKTPGGNFKLRIQQAIRSSRYFVVFLTENGMKSQWVNQELGFAVATKRKIIPITFSNCALNLKGFITKDSEDLIFIDKREDLLINDILLEIRRNIIKGLNEGVLNIILSCSNCTDNKGLDFKQITSLPSHEEILQCFSEGKHILNGRCRNCQSPLSFNLLTFQQETSELPITDPFINRPFRMRPFRF